MKEAKVLKGIILTQFEAKAIQDGRLSQLRRVIKPQPPEGAWPIYDDLDGYEGEGWAFHNPRLLANQWQNESGRYAMPHR